MRHSAHIRALMDAAYKGARAIARDFDELNRTPMNKAAAFASAADMKAGRAVVSALEAYYPDYSVLIEDQQYKEKRKSDGYMWIVDPIDGTTNFMHGHPDFTISIALAKNNFVIAGVIYVPFSRELFWGEHNVGSYVIGLDGQSRRLRVSNRDEIETLTTAVKLDYTNAADQTALYTSLVENGAKIRASGCVSLDLAYLAHGRVDLVLHGTVRDWDAAAGSIIAKEAGATFFNLDWSSRPALTLPISKPMLAGNANVLQKIRTLCSVAS